MPFTTSQIAGELRKANKTYNGLNTWDQLYGSVGASAMAAKDDLHSDYAKAISAAYASSEQQKNSIGMSNLGQGYKIAAGIDIDNALQEAYNSYRINYQKGLSEIDTSTNNAIAGINTALTTQADYVSKFANTPYEYLQYLFDKFSEEADENNIFYTDDLWKRYTYEETDEDGNLTGQRLLKSWKDILDRGAYEESVDESGNKYKDWTGLFDDAGNLTVKGADFYDQMMNYFDSRGDTEHGFGNWLETYDSDLYEWATSANPYDYTEAGTNIGSFRTMVGLTSTDQTYSFIERLGGFTKNQLDDMFSKFTDEALDLGMRIDQAAGKIDILNSEEILAGYRDLTNELKKLTDHLGITDELEKDMHMSLDNLAIELTRKTDDALNTGEKWGQIGLGALGLGGTAGGTAATAASITSKIAASGTAAGASSAVPVVGWVAAGIIAAVGAIYGAVSTAKSVDDYNRDLVQQGRTAYNNLIKNLVEYSRAKRANVQKSFTNKI